jgi:fructokinase
VPGFKVQPVDTTGAGDAFVAGLLAGLLENDDPPTPARLHSICRFANATGALATTKRGAIPGLPTRAEVMELVGANSAPKTPEVG